MPAFNFKMLMTLIQEIICIIAPPQPTKEHEASFHLDPENLVRKNLGKYQRLCHYTATSILLSPHPLVSSVAITFKILLISYQRPVNQQLRCPTFCSGPRLENKPDCPIF